MADNTTYNGNGKAKKKLFRKDLRIDEGTAARIRHQVERLRMNFPAYIFMAIIQRLERDEKEEQDPLAINRK